MRKLFLLCLSFIVLNASFAATKLVEKPIKPNTRDMMIPLGNGNKISVWDLSRISVKDAQTLTGKKMKFFDRVGFKIAQRQLRKSINPDGTMSGKKAEKVLKSMDGSSGFHIGGFALGFFLGLIGVLIAYLINDDYKSNRTKWAWLGLATIVLIVILASL
jgi:hypothetical protein